MNRPLIPLEFAGEFPRGGGKNLPNHLNGGKISDNEDFDDENQENEASGRNEYAKRMKEALQKLFETVLAWPIFQVMREREFLLSGRRRPLNISEKLKTHLLTGMRPWFQAYVERETSIMTDVTTAKDIIEYSNHWKALLPLEIRAVVQESVASLLPQCKEGTKNRFQDELDANRFLTCVVKQRSPSKGLMSLTCVSTQPMVNKRILEELQGGTICVGYISSKESSTDLILVGCRRVHWDAEDILHMGADQRPYVHEQHIEKIKLHLVVSRDGIRDLGVWPEYLVRLRQLCHFAPLMRMHEAIEESSQLPLFVKNTLFGDNCPAQETGSEIKTSVNHGCAQYLEGLQNTSAKVDDPQIDALRSVLVNIGDCAPDSRSFYLIHGPPGTGKTTTILHLIGALLNHSIVGHVGREQRNELKGHIPTDNIERCRESPGGIRILVCAPSNKGVDNILERLDRDGIPDGKGGII